MLSTFVESVPMKELFERTIRHAPTGRFEAPLLVRPSGNHTMVVQRATEYLVRNLVRRMAVEAGTELRVSMLPAEARVRQAFNVARFKPYLSEWCDHVNAARAVFKEFTEGRDVTRGHLVTACQSMALLETLLQTDITRFDRFDPRRTDAATGRELMAIWETLDARDLLAPSALAILHPQLPRTGTLKASSATLLVDGTLIDVTTRAEAAVDRDDLRLLAGKAAQALLGGVLPKGATPGAVDRIALLYARHNRLMEFGIEELFGADGWERYLDGCAELAAITREPEMEPEAMVMMA
jgi:hypothetical protein